MALILVVEDEALVLRGLVDLLHAKGYDVVTASTGPEALIKASAARPDLILLDVMLPGLSGFEVLRSLRSSGAQTPVIMLTAKGMEVDKVLGFELGVDDYVTKPFGVLELLGRLQAVLRRCAPSVPVAVGPSTLSFADVEVDFPRFELRRSGEVVPLPSRALELLRVLASEEGRVVDRDRLIDALWGAHEEVHPRTIDNLVAKLRQVIEADPATPCRLLTVHGRGYRLVL